MLFPPRAKGVMVDVPHERKRKALRLLEEAIALHGHNLGGIATAAETCIEHCDDAVVAAMSCHVLKQLRLERLAVRSGARCRCALTRECGLIHLERIEQPTVL
jgi:hypothetical protein